MVEATDRILPQYDAELTRPVMARLKALGVEVLTSTSAKGLSKDETGLEVLTADGTTKTIEADKILVTVGRKPQTDGWGSVKSASIWTDVSSVSTSVAAPPCAVSMLSAT